MPSSKYPTLTESKRIMFANAAYGDMSKRQFHWDETASLNDKNKFKKLFCNILIEEINKKMPCSGKDFDATHEGICNDLKSLFGSCSITKPINPFTLGRAQKFVNMYLKYLWMIGDPLIKDLEKSLHVPLDQKIMSKLGGVPKGGWGSLSNRNDYIGFQNKANSMISTLPECGSRIEWETRYWVI